MEDFIKFDDEGRIDSSEELWLQFLNGDMIAFRSLYNYHYQTLYNFGLKFLKPAKVEDCIHDTFLNILNYKESLKEVKNVRAYLYKSFRNQAIKTIRSNKLDFNLVEGSIPQDVEDSDKEKLISELKKLIQELSPREREIIYLKYFQEFNNMEISELLGIKYQTVRNILAGAIKKLRVLGEDYLQLLFLLVHK
ncbi:MAG: sigma-70 family RNA polymerase sigma factor [Bacteroidota bacterium]